MICNINPSECIIALVMPLLHPLILEYLDVVRNVVYCTNDKNIHVTTF